MTSSFDSLPGQVQAKIMGKLCLLSDQELQVLRGVSSKWQKILDSARFVHILLKNHNHNQFGQESDVPLGSGNEDEVTRKGYNVHLVDMTREFEMSPRMTPHVRKATLTGHFVPYNLRAVLEKCVNIETLFLNLVSKNWSKEFLRGEKAHPIVLHNLKTLHVDIDSGSWIAMSIEARIRPTSCERELCFLEYLGSGEFLFPTLETLTLAHRNLSTYLKMRHGFPGSFRPEEHRRHEQGQQPIGLQRDPDPDPGLIVPPPSKGQGQPIPSFPFSQLLSNAPNLKTLLLGTCQKNLFEKIAEEENVALIQGLTKLEEVTVLPYPHRVNLNDNYAEIRSGSRHGLEPRSVPKFLRGVTFLKSLDLSVGVKETEMECLYQVLQGNQNTLESVDIKFAMDRMNRPRTLREPFTFYLDLDLANFSGMSKLSSLILTLTNGDPQLYGYHDSLVNTSLLPQALKVFKTNIRFTREDLAGVARNLTNLEVLQIYEYDGRDDDSVGRRGGRGQDSFVPLQRELLNNNPNMVVCTIIQSPRSGDSDLQPTEPNMDAYPTIKLSRPHLCILM